MKHVLLLLGIAFLMHIQDGTAQGMHIHPGTDMQVFDNTQVGVYGNVTNEGNQTLGANAEVLFYGTAWQNATTATNLGTGAVEFVQPNTLTGTSVQQTLEGGNNAASFPILVVNNPNDIQLITNNTKVRDQLDFRDGHILLALQDLTVGDGDPGLITGYNETQFVVTNAAPTATSGFLIRENHNTAAIDYPVGIAVGDYTPASLTNSGIADDYAVRAFDSVYTSGTSGTTKNYESVGRTWHILESTVGGSNVSLNLQHNIVTEGVAFDQNSNYVARHIGVKPNSVVSFTDSEWDYVGDGNCATNLSPANITTGANIAGAARNIRAGFDNFTDYEYYTVVTCRIHALPLELDYVQANLQEEDCSVFIDWATLTEKNVSHFEVEYSTDAIKFEAIADKAAQNSILGSGYSLTFDGLHLESHDQHYFRLKMVDIDGSFTYSPMVTVSSKGCSSASDYSVFPSPNRTGQLFVRLDQGFADDQDGEFIINDVLGRTVLAQSTVLLAKERLFELDIHHLVSGTYFVYYKNAEDRILPLRKFVVISE